MTALKELQNLEALNQAQLIRVRYAMQRYWELTDYERLVIRKIVDSGTVGIWDPDLNKLYNRLRTVTWEPLQSASY